MLKEPLGYYAMSQSNVRHELVLRLCCDSGAMLQSIGSVMLGAFAARLLRSSLTLQHCCGWAQKVGTLRVREMLGQ